MYVDLSKCRGNAAELSQNVRNQDGLMWESPGKDEFDVERHAPHSRHVPLTLFGHHIKATSENSSSTDPDTLTESGPEAIPFPFLDRLFFPRF
jgi:hypothetical protein